MSHPQAYQRGLRYPRHLFLTYGWYDQNWWLVEDQNLSCTAQERESVLGRSFAFLQFDFLDGRNLTTDTGIVSPFSARFTLPVISYCIHLSLFFLIWSPVHCSVSLCFLQTGRQYYDEEQNHLGVPPLYLEQFNYSQYCHDATWTLAYALNQTVNGNVCVCVCVCVCVSAIY